MNDFSWEAEFLFTASWVSIIYALIIAFVYVKFREDYESNGNLALLVSLPVSLSFQRCHWFQNVTGETRRFPPGYEVEDL